MSECCRTDRGAASYPARHVCPVNGRAYGRVSARTIRHHIQSPWSWQEKAQGYYCCTDPDCPVVYFGQDDSVIEMAAVRTRIGTKLRSGDALVCYCYGISRRDARDNPALREFVVERTRQRDCACETRNPSGQCCLGDFPKP